MGMEFSTVKYLLFLMLLLLLFTVPSVLCDGIFERMWLLALTEECGVLQPEEDATLYTWDHCSPTLSTWKISYTPVSFFCFFVVVYMFIFFVIQYFGRREHLIPTEEFGLLQREVYPILYCIDHSSTAISTYKWNSKPVSIFVNVISRTICFL